MHRNVGTLVLRRSTSRWIPRPEKETIPLLQKVEPTDSPTTFFSKWAYRIDFWYWTGEKGAVSAVNLARLQCLNFEVVHYGMSSFILDDSCFCVQVYGLDYSHSVSY